MKSSRLLVFLSALAAVFAMRGQDVDNTIRDGGEYLIYNVYYGRLLGGNAGMSSPALSVSGTNPEESYVFVAEASSLHDGYFWLKNKQTGKYLQASNAENDTWSVWFAGSLNKSYNSYEWSLLSGTAGEIKSNRGENINSAGNAWLAPDPGHEADKYVSVYYDKPRVDRAMWQIVDARFPLDQGRLKLYADELSAAIAQGESMMENPVFGTQTEKESLAIALYNARTALEQASIATIDKMQTAKEALLAEIARLTEGNCAMWITGSSFGTGAAFTVAVRGLELKAGGACQMVVRGNKGSGAVFDITPTAIKAGGQAFAMSAGAHDLHLAFDGSNVAIYIDGAKAGEAAQGAVPTVTAAGQSAEWTVLGINSLKAYGPEIVSASAAVAPGVIPANSHGKPELNALMLVGQQVGLSSAIDYHVLADSALSNSKIDIAHPDAWVIFDNIRPSDVVEKYISSLSINGQQAVHDQNCRVAIYLHGAAVIPHDGEYMPFMGYTEADYGGEEFMLPVGNTPLGDKLNMLHSFVLKRGYMATLAVNADGSGYSRVYVADHEDKTIDKLPDLLDSRVSFIYVRKWNYVSKKGWCTVDSDEGMQHSGKLLGATWVYSWSASHESFLDMEYIPTKQHRYWPGWDEMDKLNSTAALGLNEPEHAEQHTSDRCSCGGTTDPWTACTMNPGFFYTGMRIGGPSPTDASWLKQYVDHCNDMMYRVDFVGYHAYWGTNEASNADAWKSRLKSIYDQTKRPIWITEWNNGASWTSERWPDSWNDKLDYQRRKVKEICDMFDKTDFIERYAIFNLNEDQRKVLKWDSEKGDWWVTPAGEAYRDQHPSHAYKESVQFVPTGWLPGVNKSISVNFTLDPDMDAVIAKITNPNGDFSAHEIIEYQKADGSYAPLFETARHKLDDTKQRTDTIARASMPEEAFQGMSLNYRIKVVSLKGEVITGQLCAVFIPESMRSGIDDMEADGAGLRVWAEPGRIMVDTGVAYPVDVEVYTAAGQLAARITVTGSAAIDVAPGMYIAAGRKVAVK